MINETVSLTQIYGIYESVVRISFESFCNLKLGGLFVVI